MEKLNTIKNYSPDDPIPDDILRAAAAYINRGKPEKHERPWGYFQVLYEDTHCKVKKIVIKPGQRTSLQRHLHRQETWVIVDGIGTAEIDASDFKLCYPDETAYVPSGEWHRVSNQSVVYDLVIIETQTGSYFGEEDIERKEDDYGRVGETSSGT